jgi:hypothetical protein
MIVAFTGKKGSGKDTAAAMLIERYGYTKVAFADNLRFVGSTIFGYTDAEMNDPKLKEQEVDHWPFMSWRDTARAIGTDVVRKALPDIVAEYLTAQMWSDDEIRRMREHFSGVWVKSWTEKVARFNGPVVVTDCRFLDEAEAVRSLGGVIVRITSDRTGGADGHASEAEMELIQPDLTIANDRSIEELHFEIESQLLRQFRFDFVS